MNRATFAVAGTVTGVMSLLAVKSQAIPVINPPPPALVHQFGLIERNGSEGAKGGPFGDAAVRGTAAPPRTKVSVPAAPTVAGRRGQELVANAEPVGERVTTLGDGFSFVWGVVQVQVVTVGGRLVDVQTLRIPTTNTRNTEMANASIPTMRQRVLRAQSTDVDVVTGATFTSMGYLNSVQSALDKVRAVTNDNATARASASPTPKR